MSRVGPYRLGGLLGAGGMGSVHRAEHVDLRVPVALKLLPRSTRRGFEGEVAALAALNHPGIVQIVDCGVLDEAIDGWEQGTPWIAMERLGADLATAPPPPERVHATLRQVLRALAHAHGSGLLHLDIKPSNLLWRDDEAVLADFGLARREPGSITHVSAEFAAPEQLADGTTGPWTDLYALGRTVLSWGTGGDELEPWLLRAACPSPADRFASAAEALAALPGSGATEAIHGTAGEAGPPAGGLQPGRAPVAPTRKRSEPVELDAEELPIVPDLHPSAAPPPGPPVRPLHRGAGLGVVQQRSLPLLGREPQQQALWEALLQASKTRRSVLVHLDGPAGSGRTSLATWLARSAHADCGALVLELPPHDELSTALHTAVLRHPLAQACDGLARSWLDGHLPPSLAPRALASWIDDRLTVLVIDADTTGTEALHALDAPVVVLSPTLEGADVQVELPPLPDAALQAALAALLGMDAPTAHTVAHRARGNPGVALALVNHALETGSLRSSAHGFTQHGPLSLPAKLTEPLRARLQRFSDDELAVLAFAATLGAEFVESQLPEPRESTRSRALTDGLWRRSGDRWAWTSALLRQAAIELSPLPTPELHAACARVTEGLEAAIHRALAGETTALPSLYEGFKGALGRQDLVAARRALRAARGLDLPPDEARPALMQARLAWTQNHDQAALRALEAVEPTAATLPPTLRNDYLLVRGNLLTNRMQLADALACYDQVVLQGSDTQVCHLAHGRARCLGWLHREAEALQVLDQALAHGQLDERQTHDLQLVRATTLHTLEQLDEAERTYRQLLEARPILAYQAASNLADLLRQRGDTDASRRAYEQAEHLAAAAGAELSFATVCAPTLDAVSAPTRAYARLREAIAATASDAVAAFGHFGCLHCCPDQASWEEHWEQGFSLLPRLPSDPDSVWFMERAKDHALRRGWKERAARVQAVLDALPG